MKCFFLKLTNLLKWLLKNLDLVHRMLTVGLSFIKSIVISNMLKKKSKQLSYVLRHQISEDFLLGGWFLVSNILREVDISMEELETIVQKMIKGDTSYLMINLQLGLCMVTQYL